MKIATRASLATAVAALSVALTGCEPLAVDDLRITGSGAPSSTPTAAAPATPSAAAPTTSPPAAPTPPAEPATSGPAASSPATSSPASSPPTSERAAEPTSGSTATPAGPESGGGAVARDVLALVNAQRGTAGCPPVRLDDRLTTAATGHSEDMARNDFFSHTSRDGRSFADRIRAAGYDAPRSENIAAGQRSPSEVMEAWMKSPGHRRNILDCSATEMGLGRAASDGAFGLHWTQVFGTG